MLTIKQYLELIDYKITEGSEWYANIPDLYCLSTWNGEHDGFSLNCVFSNKTQQVYEIDVCDYKNNRAYRLRHPDLDSDKTAWDSVDYVELEVDADFVEKAQAIIRGLDYDTRVQIQLDLPETVLYQLMTRAHEQDVTLNQLIENILREEINRYANWDHYSGLPSPGAYQGA